MTVSDYALYALFAIIGLLFISFIHLIIPICFARSKKTFKRGTLWLIALMGGMVGFIVCTISEEFRGLLGVLQSAFWTVIGYFILSAKCSKNNLRVPLKRADKDIKNRLAEIQKSGEDKNEYIKRLIREDIEREQT